MKIPIPYPADLNSIETAVWAAEFVRARASHMHEAQSPELQRDHDIRDAVDAANYAVADLQRLRAQ